MALLMEDMEMAVICAALVGGCIGFIPYNRNPAKIFMGDTGALVTATIQMTVMGTAMMPKSQYSPPRKGRGLAIISIEDRLRGQVSRGRTAT